MEMRYEILSQHNEYRQGDEICFGNLAVLVSPSQTLAYQPDAPFIQYQQRMQEAWAKQDQGVDEKLTGLEKRFGKKPNIIFILTDDIGWGELGWQGGGKHCGTPTPTLDQMARSVAQP